MTAVDATGGSDAFAAALAAYLAAGTPLDESIGAAQAAAAWSITHPSGHKPMPSDLG